MLSDAITWLVGQGFDFTPFDTDGDGYIDAVDVIHSGTGAEYSGKATDVWSHYSPLNDPVGYTTPEGLVFSAYHTEPEYAPDMHITQIGVVCHETGHFFGLPDLYDTTYQSAGLGLWSLMAGGSWGGPNQDGSVPTHLDAYSKQELGFTKSKLLTNSQADLVATPVELGPDAYRIATDNPSQYFLVENRQLVGSDRWLPGPGLLIYHVDEEQADNTNSNDYLVDLEQADGRRSLNTSTAPGDKGDAYPSHGNDSFTPFGRPASLAYGAQTSRVFLTNIRPAGAWMAFDFALHDAWYLGQACDEDAFCATGQCADGVCCGEACQGACHACAKAHGAPEDGVCTALGGTPCDDGDPCTVADACEDGTCKGAPMSCPAPSQCLLDGACDPKAGQCSFAPMPDGTSCSAGDLCSRGDSCKSGVCVAGVPITCAAQDSCHVAGVCAPANGKCTPGMAQDGTSCPGGACQAGVCVQAQAAEPKGCGCSSGQAPMLLAPLLLLGLARKRARA